MAAPFGPLEAYEQVMRFAAARGEDTLRLAMHASVPQVLRPELLHLLRLNFVPEAVDDPAIETDVLLAPFCEHLGNSYYRFDAHARRHLVRQLDPLYGGELVARSRRVASFLLSYFDDQNRVLSASDAVHATYVEVERWVALAFLDPHATARQLASAVRRASEPDQAAARFRLAGLSAAMTTPLAQHQALLAYAGGVEAIQKGDVNRARDLLEPLGDRDIVVGDVTLRSPHKVLDERERRPPEPQPRDTDEVEEPATSPEAPERAPERATRTSIFISYSHRDEKWSETLQTFLQPIARAHKVEIWSDRRILAGARWDAAILQAIARARVAILLVSADYLASDFLMGQEFAALERAARSGDLALIWLPLKPCAWAQSPVTQYQSVVDPEKPLSTLSSTQRDRVLVKVADTVDKVLRSRTSPPVPTPPDIFLCYRRGADDGRAGRLADRLKAAFGADRIFHDITSIEPGRDFLELITRSVEAASVMLVVIGRDWLMRRDPGGERRIDNQQDVMRFEVAAALRGGMRVIPVLLGGAAMPRPEDLPPELAPLTHRQAIQLGDQSWDRDFEMLKRALDRILGDATLSASIDEPQAALTITPTRLFIVIQKDAAGPVFNMDGRIAYGGRRPAVIYRLDAELTGPQGSSFRMRWNLFYDYQSAGLMRKTSDAHRITLEAQSDQVVGIQFLAPASAHDFTWPIGEYRFDLLAWLSPTGDEHRPDFARQRFLSVDPQVSSQIKQWTTASDDEWTALNDPHNAVAIPVSIREPERAS